MVNGKHADLCESNWLVDSGCSFHISPFKNLFSSFEKVENGFISLENEKKYRVGSLSDICLKFNSSFVLT